MKTINDIIKKPLHKIMTKHHSFYAFSNRQFDKSMNVNFTYVACGGGMYAPFEYVKTIRLKMDDMFTQAIKEMKKLYTKKDLIWYELSNHEAQITMDYSDAYEALKIYNHISENDVKKEFSDYMDYCVKKDLF